jgi:NAD(P)-dependent dehydrogenase (short-subunit alcohol dehydrogenase family)
VSDETAVDESFAETVRVLGKVDSCFANAGGGVPFLSMNSRQKSGGAFGL